MARVGGAVFPKQLQQFEAVGISNGPDGKPDTADDLNLGIVNVKWSLEEYTATFGDDDLQFVGDARSRKGCSRRTSTDRIRSAAATATTSATSGSSPNSRRSAAAARSRCARARICW